MGLSNPLHILILVVVVLLVFGARRLPEIGRSLGEGMRGFKDTIQGDPEVAALPAATYAPVAPAVIPQAAPGPVVVPIPAPAPAEQAAASRAR